MGSGRSQRLIAGNPCCLLLPVSVHVSVTSFVTGSSNTLQTLSAATFTSLKWQKERGLAMGIPV